MRSLRPLTVGLLAAPAVTGSTLFSLYDVFNSAGRDWDLVMTGRPGRGAFTPRIFARSLDPIEGGNSAQLVPQARFPDGPLPDIAIVPELLLPPGAFDPSLYAPEQDWLRAVHTAGGIVASVCSGTILLAAAGLLDGGEATTHWAYCETVSRLYPTVKVRPERMLVAAGDGERILTSGGGSGWHDLSLYLIGRYVGPDEAVRIARLYLIDWHRDGQSPFAALAQSQQVADADIARAQDWVAEHYADPAPVAGMAAASGLPERSFSRRFVKATGLTPMSYVHTLRLEEAKQALETEDKPIEEIALEVGYEDPSFFRRLFRRRVGITPGAYRRRFARRNFMVGPSPAIAARGIREELSEC